MKLEIFDVEHGGCALLTGDNGTHWLFDCGHNATTNWRPGSYLSSIGISTLEKLTITNYDEDHVSGAQDLFDKIDVKILNRNTSVSASAIKKLKSDTGTGPGIDRLIYEIEKTFTGGAPSSAPIFKGLDETQYFYNSYPEYDDENNLSLAVFIRCHGVGVMFTGDLEKAGFDKLLKNQNFCKALSQTNVYFASHHGRENGCSDGVARLLEHNYFVVISDGAHQFETQKTHSFYLGCAKGGQFRGQNRKILSTRKDGQITFTFSPNEWTVE